MTDENKQVAKVDEAPTALSVVGETEYAILKSDPGEIMQIIGENVGGDLDAFDLDRVPWPTGGNQQFTVPTLEGEENVAHIDGVIVFKKNTRCYYETPYDGSKNPPDCVADDGLLGKGNPGGECSECPLAVFGSGTNQDGSQSKGQACDQRQQLFLIRPGELLPMLLTLPPTSLKAAKRYFLRLASKAMPYYAVVTRIGLTKDKSSGGIDYSAATFSVVDVLTAEQRDAFTTLNKQLGPQLEKVRATHESGSEMPGSQPDETTEEEPERLGPDLTKDDDAPDSDQPGIGSTPSDDPA